MLHTDKDNSSLKIHIDNKPPSKKAWLVSCFWNQALSVCALVGFGGIFCEIFDIKIYTPAVILSIFICSAVQIFPPRKFHAIAMLTPAVALIILTALGRKHILNGFAFTANNILNAFGCKFSRIVPQLKAVSDNPSASQTVFFIALSIIFSYAVIFSIKSNSFVIPSVFSVSAVALCSILNCEISFKVLLPFVLYVLGIGLKKISFNSQGAVSWIASLILSCLFVFVFNITGLNDNINIKSFEQIKASVLNTVEYLRYGRCDVMPEGNFKNLKPFEPVGEQQLEVVMSQPDSLYLRGFIGESYNGSGWNSLEPQFLYENSDLFYWLHKKDFYAQTQLADISSILTNQTTLNKITVNNKGASRKYIYSPYEACIVSNKLLNPNAVGDKSLSATGAKGTKIYSFEAVENKVKSYTSMIDEINNANTQQAKEYLNNENHYREFVYKAYLTIPDKAYNVLSNQLGEYSVAKNGRLDYVQAQQNILSYLSSKVSYNSSVSFNGNNDFLQYFLEQSCEGYSVHYATAAALIFRYYGIPSRYVEGFIITPEDTKTALSNSPVNIDDTHFHAWVEFYRDGIGWIPFETTPPYLDVMESDNEISSIPDYKEPENDNPNSSPENDKASNQGQIETHEIQETHFYKYIVRTIIIILSAILMLFAFLCLFKRIKLLRKLKSFEACDNKNCVLNAFSYIIQLFSALGYIDNQNQLYLSPDVLYNKIGDLSQAFISAFKIYQKAKFSQHNITDNERALVLTFLIDSVNNIKSKNSFFKNLYNRFIRCIYK